MITAYTIGPAWGLPDYSPFVSKLLTWLRMSGVEHRAEVGDLRKAPKGKMPFLNDGEITLGDSTLIIEHLLTKGLAKPLPGDALSPRDAAVATAFKGMLEGELYFVLLYVRWMLDDGFAVYRPVVVQTFVDMGFGALVPAAVLWIRHVMKSQTKAQGMGRHKRGEVLEFGRQKLDAVAAQLGDRPYFMGDEPASIDATVFAFVDSFLRSPTCPPLQEHVRRHANLVAYCARMRQRYWPELGA